MNIPGIIITILVFFGLITFFAIGTYLNQKTPLPEGCELPSLKCEHCSSTSCSYAKPNRVTEIKKEIKDNLKKNNSGEVY
ncbi:hypothetical protein KHQ81_05465 [Mycoplasmatota bacterium]|nr:hypothetical protein KHQ81_05465 [Mycoplasmatota bacterium]